MRKICLLEKEINGELLTSFLKECGLGKVEFVKFKTLADLQAET